MTTLTTAQSDRPLSRAAQTLRQHLTEERLADYVRAAWDEVLVPLCGARGTAADHGFVHAHLDPQYPCTEWRFQGSLGFGGKFRLRSDLNSSVDCYPEDETPARRLAIDEANAAFKALRARFLQTPVES